MMADIHSTSMSTQVCLFLYGVYICKIRLQNQQLIKLTEWNGQPASISSPNTSKLLT